MKKVLSILALLVLACLVRMPVFPLSALAAGEPVWWEDEAVFATHTMDRN